MYRFAALLVSLFAAHWALATPASLITPDLSGLVERRHAKLYADPHSEYLYLYDFGSRVYGVPFPGAARLRNTRGEFDFEWRPHGVDVVQGMVTGADGNVFILGESGAEKRMRLLKFSKSSPATLLNGFDGLRASFETPEQAETGEYRGGPGVQLIARGSDRWVYFNMAGRVGRIDSLTDQIDPTWSLDISGDMVVTAANTVAIVSRLYDSETFESSIRLRIYSSDSPARIICERFESPAHYYRFVPDNAGGLHVGYNTEGLAGSRVQTVFRINDRCEAELNQRAQLVVAPMNGGVDFFSVDGRPVITHLSFVANAAIETQRLALTRFNTTGVQTLSSAMAGLDSPLLSPPAQRGNELFFLSLSGMHVVDATALTEVRRIALPLLGQPAYNLSITALETGESLVHGYFEAFYQGQQFRNLLKLRSNGVPDTQWKPTVLYSGGVIPARRGGLLVIGDFVDQQGSRIDGKYAIVDYTTAATTHIDWSLSAWHASVEYDGGEFLYGFGSADQTTVPTVRRYSVKKQAEDPHWKIELPKMHADGNYRYAGLRVLEDNAIWVLVRPGSCFGGMCGPIRAVRYQIDGSPPFRSTLTIPTSAFDSGRVRVRGNYAYYGNYRYLLSSESREPGEFFDPTPSTPAANWDLLGHSNAPLIGVTDSHAYFTWRGLPGEESPQPIVRRASLSGNGAFDIGWGIEPMRGAFGYQMLQGVNGQELPALLAITRPNQSWTNQLYNVSLQSLDLRTNTRREVVEYYHAGIRRYFITGIPSEQAALDANPAAGLVRTGMRFEAKDAYVTEAGLNPVCRFYSPPSNGGSNSHFFAQGDTCLWGRLWPSLKPEGFDFAVVPPTTSGCPTSSPKAVRRMFNNRASTNDGNHRYVVSEVTRQRLLARGWIDEGIVFCSASVVDTPD